MSPTQAENRLYGSHLELHQNSYLIRYPSPDMESQHYTVASPFIMLGI